DARISVAGITSFEFAQIAARSVAIDPDFTKRGSGHMFIAARSVAIDPDFTKRGSGHMFVSGERNLLLHHRTFFGNYREKILYEGMDCDGIITQISWQGCCIAFTNETGTRIFDNLTLFIESADLKILFYFRNANQLIALVQPTHEKQSTFAIKVRPSHCWINNETLAIGWYDTISICMIIGSSDSQASFYTSFFQAFNKLRFSSFHKFVVVSSIEKKEVEVHYAWKFDMYIADISFTLSDDKSCFWKEITVFGMKKAAVEN
uniref:CNH domain-containing protein n=1 Tax=Brugia timori TaxID=42155 RepID=A0A0R3RBP6_9BILA